MASRFVRHGPNIYNNKEIRIVLVGKTGAGKSSTGNTILGEKTFEAKFSFKSFTKECNKAFGEVDGQQVAVIDTPGLFDTCEDEEKTNQDIAQSISYASPGPHIFLVVIKLGRFTEEEKKTVQKIQQIFGEEADKYSMVLFTHGDQLKEEPIEELLKENKDLQKLVSRCNGQYHVFNNKRKDRSQVRELLNKIRKITEKNGGRHYTTEMFQKAEKKIEEEKQRILKEKEEQRRREQEELVKKIEKKYEEEIRKMKEAQEPSTSVQRPVVHHVVSHTDQPVTCTVGTHLSMRTLQPPFRSTDYNWQPCTSMNTQTVHRQQPQLPSTSVQRPVVHHVACQTDQAMTCTVGTHLSMRTLQPPFRSTDYNWQPCTSMNIQTVHRQQPQLVSHSSGFIFQSGR